MRVTCTVHLIFFYLITQRVQIMKFSLPKFLESLVIASLLGPNILFSILSSNTLNLCSSLRVTGRTGSRVRFPVGAGNFSLHHRIQNSSRAHPASYPTGTRALSLGVKRPGHEADHSLPSSAEVKNAWSYTSTPPIRLHDVVLSQTQGQLYLLPL
jgi:hypothetical protein